MSALLPAPTTNAAVPCGTARVTDTGEHDFTMPLTSARACDSYIVGRVTVAVSATGAGQAS